MFLFWILVENWCGQNDYNKEKKNKNPQNSAKATTVASIARTFLSIDISEGIDCSNALGGYHLSHFLGLFAYSKFMYAV